jgi:hypothetical protein
MIAEDRNVVPMQLGSVHEVHALRDAVFDVVNEQANSVSHV